ncbi:PPE domain-containing protein [Streptomyces sp. URMC 125]|uniref:PPE domain-containing protein n=1 Tax=Streptomyces sp. URMC 125 TaxID=3423419 RepID=UPI003F1C7522
MTLQYSTVRDADLGPLTEAVAKWRNLPGQLKAIATSFRADVSSALRASDWKGRAADSAFKKFSETEKQMEYASEEARDVHHLLNSALESFRSAQKRLRDVATEVSEDRNLKLSPTGVVYLDPDDKKDPDRLAVLRQGYEDVIRGYNDRIKAALADATEADTALHWALIQDPNGRSPGFHPDMFGSIKDAQEGRAQARKDADRLVRLAALGENMTNEQLVQFDRLARKHEGDPYFAERFAVKVGPERVLRLWQGLADVRPSDGEAEKTLASIQKSLSYTLATATHSHSEDMKEWKMKMINLGDERIYFTQPDKLVASTGSYGFQLMSSLMRHGEYDTEFLKSYGKELLAFEKKHDGPPEDLWYVDGHRARLSFGSDSGNDPVAGYLEALGHNPEAAKSMFHSKSWDNFDNSKDFKKQLDPDLRYLFNERQWLNDSPQGDNRGGGYGYEELGHALESATLGVPYNAPEMGLDRDRTTANIMEQVVLSVAGEGSFANDRPGIEKSLAKMGAGYMDDINYSMSNFGDSKIEEERGTETFKHYGDGHVNVGHATMNAFLSNVGKGEEGYAILSAAQRDYTVSGLMSTPGPDEDAERLISTSAKVYGALDEARLSEIHATHQEGSEEANRKLAESAEWDKFGYKTALAAGTAAVAFPFAGPTAAAGTAFAVPLLATTGAGALETQYGIEMSRELEKQKVSFENREGITKLDFTSTGEQRAMRQLDAYIIAHGLEGSEWAEDMRGKVEEMYTLGGSASDRVDRD